MKRRIAIPKPEADYWANEGLRVVAQDLPSLLKPMGLYTWSPDPWDVHVEDTRRPYFFWVYRYEIDAFDDADAYEDYDEWLHDMGTTSGYLTVGTDHKGGDHAAGGKDVVVEDWEDDEGEVNEGALANMKPAKPSDFRKFKLTDMEVLAILGGS